MPVKREEAKRNRACERCRRRLEKNKRQDSICLHKRSKIIKNAHKYSIKSKKNNKMYMVKFEKKKYNELKERRVMYE